MMTRCSRRLFLGGALLGPVLLIACGGEQAAGAVPPEIAYDRDTCDRCGMIISDERYAGALVAEDGAAELFDDAGELVQAVREAGLNGRRAWVHDWNSREWIDATTATYVQGAKETTPMGTGIVAFATRESAETHAADEGVPVLSWDELIAAEG